MKTRLLIQYAILPVPILFAASFIFVPAQAADHPRGRTLAAGPEASGKPGIAAGAAEDTLKACMSRIPKDASIGQRMIAEQGCMRDESDRQPFEPVRGARIARHQSP
jgi:hypothetical protein